MPYVQFLLVCEGPTDIPLQEHIRKLLIWVGAGEVVGSAPNFKRLRGFTGHDVESKLQAAVQLEPGANLVIVHRDSDGRDPDPRHDEIEAARRTLGIEQNTVPVVPVQETEAWLLLDEEEIKRAAGNPSSRADLGLPGPTDVERVASPKDVLYEALLEASGTTGRRRERFRTRLPAAASQLLRRLPVQGEIERVPAWQRFRADLRDAIARL